MNKSILLSFLLLISLLLPQASVQAASALDSAEMESFISEMAAEPGFDRAKLEALFAQASLKQNIIDAISRPAEGKPWYEYRKIFLTDRRISGGIKFMQENARTLQKVEETYGVPPQIITAIIGVETYYGKHAGNYRVIDSLSTLAFNYPKRGKFFRSELKHFLLLASEQGFDPLELMGSYAGAMGMPQFISSSYRSYAVDFDGDGKSDIWQNRKDVIGSVANYFRKHGWLAGEPVAIRALVEGEQYRALLEKGMQPLTPLEQIPAGIQALAELQGNPEVSLIELNMGPENQYWLGLNNFYVITRYNHSELYAMAVYQLSQEILHGYVKHLTP